MFLYNSLTEIPSFFSFSRSSSISEIGSSNFPRPILVKTLMEMENMEEAAGFLKQIFGERIVGEVLERYAFDEPLTAEKIQIILCSIGARATADDLKQLHAALQNLESSSIDAETFLAHLTMEELAHLADLAKRCPFGELDNDGLEQLLSFFRSQLGGNGERISLAMPEGNLDLSYEANQHYKQDKKLLETLKEHTRFDCSAALNLPEKEESLSKTPLIVDVEDLAISEYFSRGLAYTSLRKGMVLPAPTKSQTPEYFQVERSIEKNGFAYFLLSKMDSENPKKFHVLFRGTVPTELASISHCFGESVGLKPFTENAEEILEDIKAALAQYPNTSIEFNGHSQGGALAQHGLEILLNEFNQSDSPVHSAQRIRLAVWNSPSVLEKEAENIADNLEGMAKNPMTMNTKVEFAYNIIDPDIVHTFGELLAGYYLKSFNASRQIIRYQSTGSGPLGHHCSPILTRDADHKVVEVHTEGREKVNKTLKAIAYLAILIRHHESDHQQDSEIDAEELDREFSIMDSIEKDLGDDFTLAMQSMDAAALKILKEQLEENLMQDIQVLENNSQELANAMRLSTYKNLSQLDQYTGGAIVGIAKGALYDMLNPQVSAASKVKKAALLGVGATAGTVALYGIGAVAVANPVTAAVVVGGAGLAVGTHFVVEKVRKKFFG